MSNQERIYNLIGKPFSCIIDDEIKFFNMISVIEATPDNVSFKAHDLQNLNKEIEISVPYENIISAAFIA
jgi:hypothetical protein